ncbi:hypothetical protein BBN09_10605 [Vibrio parahaemolyticus]|jgi:phage gp16-like protein|uniref:hypothetical protein n=1 Tax=Vibrio TaxID=662 RepID=UPI0005EF9278|nr:MULTISPECIES: hypothetical protein [Vibrio]OEB90882.1 hypothetical protein BBN09_10605 [Vibrio parahaemolyticus]
MAVNSNQELQKKITQLCHQQGLTRRGALEAVKIKQSKRDLTVDELSKLSLYLKVSIQELFL